jgi:hypothetical protein
VLPTLDRLAHANGLLDGGAGTLVFSLVGQGFG